MKNMMLKAKFFTTLAVLLTSPALASAATDIDISSYYTESWAPLLNGSEIVAAPKDGNAGTGITFGDWNGSFVAVDPGYTSTIDITPTLLSAAPIANGLFNTYYGVGNEVNATVIFKNNLGETDTFALVGDQTIRDYNNSIYANELLGSNTNPSYGAVTAQNWWNNTSQGGAQRLDVATFVLPTSWAGTDLTSVELEDPYYSSGTDDILFSALQVSSTPEPSTYALILLGGGLLLLVHWRRIFARS